MDADKLLTDAAFEPADRARWLALARKALGDETSLEALAGRTDDAIVVEPLAEPRRDAVPLTRKAPSRPWRIVQRCDDTDVARANRQAHEDVENGATGLSLVFEGAPNAFGYGLPEGRDTLAAVLDGIPLDKVHLRSDAHPSSRAMADHLVEYLAKTADPSRLSISFGIDSAATFAGTGRLRMSLEALQASLPQSLAHFFAMGVPGVLLEADGRVFHNAGATEAQELAAMLAGGVSHMRLFAEARQALVYAVPHVGFAVSVDQDQFLSMAKIRALRLLWHRAQAVCGIEPVTATIHAETSYRMVTSADPETNILRNTLAAFAAATGGADTISVLPHTIAHGLPAAFARRLARNTQLLLANEGGLDFVADPAVGSAGIEALTAALCESAWPEFQRIEAEGGLLRSLSGGHFQGRVAEASRARLDRYRDGGRNIVGTTAFEAASTRPVETIAAERRPPPTDGTIFCERMIAARLDELLGPRA
jgi:methylmalonyl-CoA mutase